MHEDRLEWRSTLNALGENGRNMRLSAGQRRAYMEAHLKALRASTVDHAPDRDDLLLEALGTLESIDPHRSLDYCGLRELLTSDRAHAVSQGVRRAAARKAARYDRPELRPLSARQMRDAIRHGERLASKQRRASRPDGTRLAIERAERLAEEFALSARDLRSSKLHAVRREELERRIERVWYGGERGRAEKLGAFFQIARLAAVDAQAGTVEQAVETCLSELATSLPGEPFDGGQMRAVVTSIDDDAPGARKKGQRGARRTSKYDAIAAAIADTSFACRSEAVEEQYKRWKQQNLPAAKKSNRGKRSTVMR